MIKYLMGAGAAVLLAGSAQAQIFTVTETGVILSGVDKGAFGTSVDLTGQAYSVTFTYDVATTDSYSGSGTGWSFLGREGLGSVSFTIGGVTQTMSAGGIQSDNNAYLNRQNSDPTMWAYSATTTDNVFAANGDGVYDMVGFNGFSFANLDPTSNVSLGSNVISPLSMGWVDVGHTHLAYGITSFEAHGPGLLDVSAVPEPAGWALMLGGFGLIGLTLRSRRKAAVRFA